MSERRLVAGPADARRGPDLTRGRRDLVDLGRVLVVAERAIEDEDLDRVIGEDGVVAEERLRPGSRSAPGRAASPSARIAPWKPRRTSRTSAARSPSARVFSATVSVSRSRTTTMPSLTNVWASVGPRPTILLEQARPCRGRSRDGDRGSRSSLKCRLVASKAGRTTMHLEVYLSITVAAIVRVGPARSRPRRPSRRRRARRRPWHSIPVQRRNESRLQANRSGDEREPRSRVAASPGRPPTRADRRGRCSG